MDILPTSKTYILSLLRMLTKRAQ